MSVIMTYKLKYNITLPLCFSLIDILLFGDVNWFLQSGFAIICYLFLLFAFFNNNKIGIMYLISFNLLTIGWGNYDAYDNITYGYWGLRISGLTLNILIQFMFFCVLTLKKKSLTSSFCCDYYSRFFLIYFFWSLLIYKIP